MEQSDTDLCLLIRNAVADALDEVLPSAIREASLPTFMSRSEAAEYLGVSVRKLDRLRASGCVPHVRRGRRVMFQTEDLRSYLAEGYVPTYESRQAA